MNSNHNIIQCPVCGSMNLKAMYDQSKEGGPLKSFLKGGLVGLAFYASGSEKTVSTYWACQRCGNTFPMDEEVVF